MGIDRLTNQIGKERRDLAVLEAVIEDGPIGIVRLAEETDISEHKVRYSLRMLENDELVTPTPNGARAVDDIDERVGTVNDGLDHLVERVDDLRTMVSERAD